MNRKGLSVVVAFGLIVICGLNLTGQEKAEARKAPAEFKVKFETTAGDFVIEVHRAWSPNGADRFFNLVESKFYDDCKFFRVLPNFMVQFGINGNPKVSSKWKEATFRDDPVMKANKRGFVTYAKASRPNSRTTQVFINYKTNASLDQTGFSPFGQVIEGMEVVDMINSQYKEEPDQGRIQIEGNDYLERSFPKLDGIKTARIID